MASQIARLQTVAVILIIVGSAMAYGIIGNYHQRNAASEAARLEAAMAVSVLPTGIENAWIAYVDKQVSEKLIREGGFVEVLETSNLISINTPIEISCSVIGGASVQFGYGDDETTVNIFEPFETKNGEAFDPTTQPSPPLGVNFLSFAAGHLENDLCLRVGTDVSKIMAEH